MKNEVKEWLESFDYEGVEPVTVTIGKQTWEGARYAQDGQPRIYLVGKLPKGYKNSQDKVVYYNVGDQDYYVICYMQEYDDMEDHFKAYPPFGDNFVIALSLGGCSESVIPSERRKMVIA